MRKFSLLLAAAAVVVALAVSGGASAENMPSNYDILTKGEILMKDGHKQGHAFTVHYDRVLYVCAINGAKHIMRCKEIKGQTEQATKM